MDRELTFLERGVFVRIEDNEFKRYLGNASHGYLPRCAYPQEYEDIAEPKEVGRDRFFRFILDEEASNG